MKVNTNTPSHSGIAVEKAKSPGVEQGDKTGISKDKSALTQGGSSIDISDDARLLQRTQDLVKNLPDVDKSDKISSLKKSIQQGTYHVSAESIADKLVDDHLNGHLGKNAL